MRTGFRMCRRWSFVTIGVSAWLLCEPLVRGEEFLEAELLIVGGTESACGAAVEALPTKVSDRCGRRWYLGW
jgi:hypothetical protein